MGSEQASHEFRLRELKQAYPEALNRCRTLDEYIHESIDELNVNFRNGDQVVSHFIERSRRATRSAFRLAVELETADEPPGMITASPRPTKVEKAEASPWALIGAPLLAPTSRNRHHS
jgi:hypothetical protein